jgi:hypothetical protein
VFGQGSTVVGGVGDDMLFFTSGGNVVNGGAGDDDMVGFATNDLFVFSFELEAGAASSDDGFDEIFGFAANSDKLRFDFSADDGWDAGLADDAEKLAFLEDLFMVNGGTIALDDGTWSVTVDSGFPLDAFAVVDMYVNDVLIG